jgi:cholesterol oxidase
VESRRRWKDEDLPKSQWHLPDFLWFPAAELYRIPRTVERLWQRRFVSRFQ